MGNRILIYNVEIVTAGRVPTLGRVIVDGDTIEAVEANSTPDGVAADIKIDGHGALLLPGGIDEHVHFREPGMTEKATIETESLAAVAGGVTSYLEMPNVVPPTTSMDLLDEKMAIAAKTSAANYGFYIGATSSNIDRLATLDYSRVAGVKLFIGATTGSLVLDDDELLEKLFSSVPALIAVHAEDNVLIEISKQQLLDEQGGGSDLPIEMHPRVRSRQACLEATRRAISLAEKHNARLHIMHISTADELSLLTAGNPVNKRITSETCPQYLLFDSSDYKRLGARIKCNPAIKDKADREALIKAIKTGLIDVIATDHAPHLLSDKQGGALKATSGMPMVQFSMPLMLDLFGPEIVADKMSAAPAKMFGIERRGEIVPGFYADLVMIERLDEPCVITDDEVVGKCGWTPVAGMSTNHRVVLTLVNGSVAWSLIDGIKQQPLAAKPLKFNNNNTIKHY